jgi:hypothetical protein
MVTKKTATGTVMKIALKSTLSFNRKIGHEIKPIITINIACFVGGNQYQAILKSAGVKSLMTPSTKLWKRKSKRNVRFNSTKPKTATARANKTFLT